MNKQLHRILIPIDFHEIGEIAMEHGAYLANAFRADIYLLHCGDGHTSYPAEWYKQEDRTRYKEILQTKAAEKLDHYAEDYTKRYGVFVKPVITTGNPAKKITDAVTENDIDLIVMGTHGASGFEEFFMGNTARKVVNLSPCPVITVHPSSSPPSFKNIILPIDNTRYSRQKVSNVLPIAAKCNSTVHVLGLPQSRDKDDLAKFYVKVASVEEAVKNLGLQCVKKIAHGDNLANEAMKYSEEVRADLLAIMTDHESHLTGIFMGAFARQIVNHSKIPVLSIKPMEIKYEASA